jgi:hypothetical protein
MERRAASQLIVAEADSAKSIVEEAVAKSKLDVQILPRQGEEQSQQCLESVQVRENSIHSRLLPRQFCLHCFSTLGFN